MVGEEEVLAAEQLAEEKQKSLRFRIDSQERALGTKVENNRDRTCLILPSLKHARDWLNSVPSAKLGLHLCPPEFWTVALYCLGIPLFQSEGNFSACPLHSDRYRDEKISRLNLIKDLMFHIAALANLLPLSEAWDLLPGSEARPVDPWFTESDLRKRYLFWHYSHKRAA